MSNSELANLLSNEYLIVGDTRSVINQAFKKFGLKFPRKSRKFYPTKNQKKKGIVPFSTKDKKWQALRAKVFNLYGRQCMECRSAESLQIDHIKPKSRYPELAYNINNLQVLCKKCNMDKSNINCNDYREKYANEELDIAILMNINSLYM